MLVIVQSNAFIERVEQRNGEEEKDWSPNAFHFHNSSQMTPNIIVLTCPQYGSGMKSALMPSQPSAPANHPDWE